MAEENARGKNRSHTKGGERRRSMKKSQEIYAPSSSTLKKSAKRSSWGLDTKIRSLAKTRSRRKEVSMGWDAAGYWMGISLVKTVVHRRKPCKRLGGLGRQVSRRISPDGLNREQANSVKNLRLPGRSDGEGLRGGASRRPFHGHRDVSSSFVLPGSAY